MVDFDYEVERLIENLKRLNEDLQTIITALRGESNEETKAGRD